MGENGNIEELVVSLSQVVLESTERITLLLQVTCALIEKVTALEEKEKARECKDSCIDGTVCLVSQGEAMLAQQRDNYLAEKAKKARGEE